MRSLIGNRFLMEIEIGAGYILLLSQQLGAGEYWPSKPQLLQAWSSSDLCLKEPILPNNLSTITSIKIEWPTLEFGE